MFEYQVSDFMPLAIKFVGLNFILNFIKTNAFTWDKKMIKKLFKKKSPMWVVEDLIENVPFER